MNQTDLIIFDLGRVLVDFDFRKVIRGLQRYSPLPEKAIRSFFSVTPFWDAFERGRVTPHDFFEALKKNLRLKGLNYPEFCAIWNDIFTEKHDAVAIVRKLRGRYRLALLSNVNEMHWKHVHAKYPFLQWFDHPIASYAVGHRKPDAEIYRITLRRAGIPPHRALFIDDVASHIAAARALGIRAHQFHNTTQLLSDLEGILE